MTERYLYLPLVGMAIVAAPFLAEIEAVFSSRLRKAAQLIPTLILATYGFITPVKASAWRDLEVLVQQTLETYPNSFNMRMSLGQIYHKRGLYFETLKQYGEALRASPRNWRVRYLPCNMGASYREMGDYSSAIVSYDVALRLALDLADAHVKLGRLTSNRATHRKR